MIYNWLNTETSKILINMIVDRIKVCINISNIIYAHNPCNDNDVLGLYEKFKKIGVCRWFEDATAEIR